MSTIRRTPVTVARDLTKTMEAEKNDAMALQREIGGMSNADLTEMWGTTIGKSNVAPDFFDGRVNKNETEIFAQVAQEVGVTKALRNIAIQGSQDPGVGVLHRHDGYHALDGEISSLGVISGTATKGKDGSKVKGDGATVAVQVQYEATQRDTVNVLDAMAGAVKLDEDGGGKPLNIKARLNLDGRICEDGLRDLHLSAAVENTPAIDALLLMNKMRDEYVELPVAPLLAILMQVGAEAKLELRNGDAQAGFKLDLAALNELERQAEAMPDFDDEGNPIVDGEELEPMPRRNLIPSAVLSANAEGDMEVHDEKLFFNPDELEISLDSKVNILWDDDGNISLEIQDMNGDYQPYDTGEKFGMDLHEGFVLMMLDGAFSALNN